MKEVSQKLRKKMDSLLDDEFIKNFLAGNLAAFFDGAKKIEKIEKIIHKDVRGLHDYSLIIEFILTIKTSSQDMKKSVFCKAHSDEKKNKAIYYMEILYKNGFNDGIYRVPRPLSYLPDLRAGFYEGEEGHNLLYYLEQKDCEKIEKIIKDAAGWITKLHSFDYKKFNSLGLKHAKIKDNAPPTKKVLEDMQKYYPKLYYKFEPLYSKTLYYERTFLRNLKRQEKTSLIYADYHPQNIIIPKYSHEGITVIDFTDLAIGDPHRDVGTFMEQAGFMGRLFMSKEQAYSFGKLFLDEYFKINGITPHIQDYQRINLYCLWTALRNIVYFFYKKDPDNVNGQLIEDANIYLEKIKAKKKEL